MSILSIIRVPRPARRSIRASVLVGLTGAGLLAGCGGAASHTSSPSTSSTSGATSTTGGSAIATASNPGRAPHVLVLVMENRSYSDVVGNRAAPYQTSLAHQYETATASYGVGHHSLVNYLALISGKFYSWGESDCSPGSGCRSNDPTLANQLDAHGIPWAAYMETMPTACDHRDDDRGSVAHGYAARHDPFVYFTALRSDCGRVQNAAGLLGALNSPTPPSFAWLTPSVCHDGGGDDSCATLQTGDQYLARQIPAIQATAWYRDGGVILLTYDEGNVSGQSAGKYLHGEGNHILTVLISRATAGAAPYHPYVNDFGVLAGIEKAYGLPCLGEACSSANGSLPVPTG